jgi:hypothetical protein
MLNLLTLSSDHPAEPAHLLLTTCTMLAHLLATFTMLTLLTLLTLLTMLPTVITLFTKLIPAQVVIYVQCRITYFSG